MACPACVNFHNQYVVPLKVASLPLQTLSTNRSSCDLCFNEKIATCNSYKADMQKHQSQDPRFITSQQIDVNWKKCLLPADQPYKDRAIIDATMQRLQAQKTQAAFNSWSNRGPVQYRGGGGVKTKKKPVQKKKK